VPFCPQCGAENPSSASYCDQCGATLIPVAGPAGGGNEVAAAPANAVAAGAKCPQCGMAVIPGEAFCDNCGASLLSSPPVANQPGASSPPFGGMPPQPQYPAPQPVGPVPSPGPLPITQTAPPPPSGTHTTLAAGQLIILPENTTISLPAALQVTIGRADPASSFYPEIDLTPYGALEKGVGRRHLRLFLLNSQLSAEDLDSTNGSFLNGIRLAPRAPQPLQNGDELRLGTMTMNVRVQS